MYRRLNSIAHTILPSSAYNLLIGTWDRQGLKKYFHNTGWMFAGRLITLVVSFFTIFFVARYLGPENLGKLSYAQSFIAIFSMFASLGIDQVVYRELVARPEDENEILGTAIAVKIVFGLLTFFFAIVAALFINNEPLLTWLIAIIALTFIFQPFGTVTHVFNARVLSKYPTYISLILAFLIPALKLAVIYFDKGILYFASILALEALMVSSLTIIAYTYILKGSPLNWRSSWLTFTQLVHDSWPLMLVGVTGYIYIRIDQVMIQHFIDSRSVGLYEAAVRLTEPLGFIPGLIMGSLFPALINAKSTNPTEYKKRLRSLALLCLGISSILASIIFILAPLLIHILYGSEFAETVLILRIYVWSTVGTIATFLMYNYFLAENRPRIQLYFTLGGATLNIFLNYFFIPRWGAEGAATATLITVSFIVGLFLLTRKHL